MVLTINYKTFNMIAKAAKTFSSVIAKCNNDKCYQQIAKLNINEFQLVLSAGCKMKQ